MQGRVFSARHLLVQMPYLVGILIAGILANGFAIPVLLIGSGIAGGLVFIFYYLVRDVRDVETLLPDA